jgi:phosphoribosylformylglycinamidine cyclo-ligase
MQGNAYRAAGVDIDAGNALVERIKPFAKATSRAGVMGGLGGFGALFDTKAAGYRDPVLVSATDGVGTKIKIAIETGRHDKIGVDLVAMCVNDLIVQGAEPLFFLDYFASGRLDVETAAAVIEGIAEGCRQANCALIGGETAEMPGLYHDGDYDLAGFSVGAVERDRILTGADVQPGDVVFGLPSTGIHSNGFSLIRKIVADARLDYRDPSPFLPDATLGESLLVPTAIYVRALMPILKDTRTIKALAHITGGGLLENIPRVLPDGLGVMLDARTWELPEVFRWVKATSGIGNRDLARTLNCGIGMVAICGESAAADFEDRTAAAGQAAHRIGVVNRADSAERVEIAAMDETWGS